MEFFILLVLCFCCCQATPLSTKEEDCNDPKVFNAVDLALQKFNRDRTHGNKFALDVVTEARKAEGPGSSFLVKYRLKETICALGEDIPWQNCAFRDSLEAELGECTAHIYIDEVLNLSDISQECKAIPAEGKVTASRAMCTGCWSPIANNSLDLLPLVRHTIRKFNRESYHPSLFEVLEIKHAQSQVVAGWNYAFDYLIKETNCSKEIFPDLTPACKRIPGGREGKCRALAHINISKSLSFAVQECALQVEEVAVRRCLGCPRPLASNSSELEEPLRLAVEKYNSESNDEAYYKVEEILKATVQVVAGKKYIIDFILVKTNCLKADLPLSKDCSSDENDKWKCTASIYVVHWQSKVFPNVTCYPHRVEAVVVHSCPGCPQPLASNNPKLEEPLRLAMEKYNSESNNEAYYKVQTILEATVQVVDGEKYIIDFILVKTNCSKADLPLSKDCSPDESDKRRCTASIYMIPRQSKVFRNVTCYLSRAAMMFAWPPGMTPFRMSEYSVRLAPTERRRTAGNPAANFPGSRRGLGSGLSRARARKQEHEQVKVKSSEVSHGSVGKKEVALPGPAAQSPKNQPSTSQSSLQEEEPNKNGAAFAASPIQQDSTGESHGFSNTDLLPGPGAPKCPGKPWKPVIAFPATNPELVSGAGAGTEHHEADFDLADAL